MSMICVIDGADIVGAVDYYKSIIWAVQFAGRSEFELTLPCTADNVGLLQEGRILCRGEDRDGATFKNCMIIRKVSFSYTAENGYLLTVRGKGLKDILSQRVIWNRETSEDVRVDAYIETLLTSNMMGEDERQFPLFTFGTFTGEVPTVSSFQLFGENLGEWMESAAHEYNFGWDVYITGGAWTFDLYTGTDRTRNQSAVPPVVFSPEMDNLISCEYNLDLETYKNAAIIGGEGEGNDKRTAEIGTAEHEARFEAYVDGSGVSSDGEIITEAQYQIMLEQYGQTELAEGYNTVETFSAEIDTRAPYEIGSDFLLGDIVEVAPGFGIVASARLEEIIESEDENGKTTLGTFEEWRVI